MPADIKFRAMRDDNTAEGAVCADILQAYENFKACDAETKRLVMIVSQGASSFKKIGILQGNNPNNWFGQVRMTNVETINVSLRNLQTQIKADNTARYAAEEQRKAAEKQEAMRLKVFKADEHPEIVSEVKKNVSIIDAVNRYTKVEQNTAGEYIAKSPLYKNGKYTLLVDDKKQTYYELAYGVKGNAIDFIVGAEKLKRIAPLSREDVIKRLINESPEKYSDEVKDVVFAVEKKVDEINRMTEEFYHKGIGADEGKCLEYFKSRGFSSDTIEKFKLGYAKGDWNGLRSYMHKNNIGDEQLEAAGVITKSAKNGRYYDAYHDRAMIPIHDKDGKCVGFGGRTLVNDDAKYLNTKATVCFDKSETLFNFNIAKDTRQPSIIVVEGFMDCISAYQSGFDNCVAGMGTALTEQQAELLKSTGKEVVLAYDADESGQKASASSRAVLESKGVKVSMFDMTQAQSAFTEQRGTIKDFNDILMNYGFVGISLVFENQKLNVNTFGHCVSTNNVSPKYKGLIEKTLKEQNVMYVKKEISNGNSVFAFDTRNAKEIRHLINQQIESAMRQSSNGQGLQ